MSATGPSQMYHVSQYDGPDPREVVAAMLEQSSWLRDFGLSTEPTGNLLSLLKRADDVLRMIPPPLSDCYTNGLQPDIQAVLDRGSPT